MAVPKKPAGSPKGPHERSASKAIHTLEKATAEYRLLPFFCWVAMGRINVLYTQVAAPKKHPKYMAYSAQISVIPHIGAHKLSSNIQRWKIIINNVPVSHPGIKYRVTGYFCLEGVLWIVSCSGYRSGISAMKIRGYQFGNGKESASSMPDSRGRPIFLNKIRLVVLSVWVCSGANICLPSLLQCLHYH